MGLYSGGGDRSDCAKCTDVLPNSIGPAGATSADTCGKLCAAEWLSLFGTPLDIHMHAGYLLACKRACALRIGMVPLWL